MADKEKEDRYSLVHLSSNIDCTSYCSCSISVPTEVQQGRESSTSTILYHIVTSSYYDSTRRRKKGYSLVHLSSNLDCTSHSSCSICVPTMVQQGREILVATEIQQGHGREILPSISEFQP